MKGCIYTLIFTFMSYKYPRKSQSRNYICQNKCNHVVQPNKKEEVVCMHNSMQMNSHFHLAVMGIFPPQLCFWF